MEVRFPVVMRHTITKTEVRFTASGVGTVTKSDEFAIGEHRTDWTFDTKYPLVEYWEPVETKRQTLHNLVATYKET